ncbi:hypothetical protein [Sphingomonas glacialis]|uniref:hypothetical protein n=1 Tax=Sphingomonas glacialis TaxID=658225 RepID=UPI001125B34D|nr:hypothetical protein [Sphingomonas glacialis]
MLMAFFLAGLLSAPEDGAPAGQVRWHPSNDRNEVKVYGAPCPPPAKDEVASCHWSIPEVPHGVSAFIKDHHLRRYGVVFADLNGDNQPEALIYAVATVGGGNADLCGTGGCDLYILTSIRSGYRQVGRVSVSRLPVRILSSTTHGWHDLSVRVAGGGVTTGYDARLRFEGQSYPSNPSVLPAMQTVDAKAVTAIGNIPPLP